MTDADELHDALRGLQPANLRAFALLAPRHELVTFMAGTPVRSSQTYRSAARRVQRWAGGGQLTERSRVEITAFARQQRWAVDLDCYLIVSDDERTRSISVTLTKAQTRGILSADNAGHREVAWQRFEDAVLRQYGIQPAAAITEVTELSIEPLEPS